MANKQYKDFSAGSFANDQIIAQQSTTDDSYTKVPVPTFGLGDNVANENRVFNFDQQQIILSASNATSSEASHTMTLENDLSEDRITDNDSGSHSLISQDRYGILLQSSDSTSGISTEIDLYANDLEILQYDSSTDNNTQIIQSTTQLLTKTIKGSDSAFSQTVQDQDETRIQYKNTSLFSQSRTGTIGIEQKVQDDETSPTIQGITSQDLSETNIKQHNVDDSAVGFVSVKKDQINIKVNDATNQNYFHADTENMSLVGTSGIPFDFYNSENRLYMSLHLMNFGGLGNYASNAAAISAGLSVGDIYRNGADLKIVI